MILKILLKKKKNNTFKKKKYCSKTIRNAYLSLKY